MQNSLKNETQKYGGYSHIYRKRRSKADWAGVGIGDAFKSSLDYYLRVPAQRRFYRMMKEAQTLSAKLAGGNVAAGYTPNVKPQLGPCYTTYPSTVAAHAAIGLTAFLEFRSIVGSDILSAQLKEYLDNPVEADRVDVPPALYAAVACTVTEAVQTRLFIEEFSRHAPLAGVELYRLFSASQQNLRFISLDEIIKGGILYGDTLPELKMLALHPLTAAILVAICKTSAPYFADLATVSEGKMLVLGADWVKEVCIALSSHLPRVEDLKIEPWSEGMPERRRSGRANSPAEETTSTELPTGRLSPLDDPLHPMMTEGEDAGFYAVHALFNNSQDVGDNRFRRGEPPALEENVKNVLDSFAHSMGQACGQEQKWEDMRSDIVERKLRKDAFNNSPIEGHPLTGHEVHISFGKGSQGSGEIFDRPVELSDDYQLYRKLTVDAAPVAALLRRNLYPNRQQVQEVRKFCCSGLLDPARLALADAKTAIFKRYVTVEREDRRGEPVIVIACDGSGSLRKDQINLLKILCTAWLVSTARSDVQVMACMYHSGEIRSGNCAPLIQWIFHPQKTLSTSRRDAIRAVASLPESGTGMQSDALSLGFILDEAKKLARGNMVYLTLISDTAWNRSFHTELSGEEEVKALFTQAYERFMGKLHVTLVALGIESETGFEQQLDSVISVANKELENAPLVATKIGDYVAGCLRERRKKSANSC